MKIYCYSIINSNHKLPCRIKGLQAGAVYNIPYRDIGIVVSEFNELFTPPVISIPSISSIERDEDCEKNHSPALFMPAYVLKHEDVVEALMKNFNILPFKFFTVFNSNDDILAVMENYYNDFIENLDRLYNKVEFGLKVIWPGKIIKNHISKTYTENNHILPEDSPAKTFINEKLKNYRIEKKFIDKANNCVDIINNCFNKFIIEKRIETLKSTNLLLNASYLVSKEKVNDLQKAFESLIITNGGFKYLFSGPWPPYNFIRLNKKVVQNFTERSMYG